MGVTRDRMVFCLPCKLTIARGRCVPVKMRQHVCSCLLRIIDSFGTEPAFNHDVYAKGHHLKTQWGMQNLNPQQFFTMFR